MSSGSGLPASMPLPFVFTTPVRVRPCRGMVSSRSRTTLSVETSFTMSRISASAIAWSWMMPKRRAAGDAYWTVASESTTTKASGMTATSWRSVDCTGTRGPNRDVFFAAPNRLGSLGSTPSCTSWKPRLRPSRNATTNTTTATTTNAATTDGVASICSNVMRSPSDNPQFFLKTSGFGEAFAYAILSRHRKFSCRSSSETQHIGI